MFDPSHGRLAYGKGRIAAIFAHYNLFGYNKDGSPDKHTGDSFITFNESGEDAKLGWSWQCSHSLEVSILYDGEHFYAISLGDANPMNSNISWVSPNDEMVKYGVRLLKSSTKLVHEKDVPGDGFGNTAGRNGGIVKIGEEYVVAFTRNKCSFPTRGMG